MRLITKVNDGSNQRKSESKIKATETLKRVLELLTKKSKNEK